MQGTFSGMRMKGGGTWSLEGDVVSYTSGDNSDKAKVRIVDGKLLVDPDFLVRVDGTIEVSGEYER